MVTAKQIHINERQRYNLIKMGLWLHNNKERLKQSFIMETFFHKRGRALLPRTTFSKEAEYRVPSECGANCCIIGHSVNPNIGLELEKDTTLSKLVQEEWHDVGDHLFGIPEESQMQTDPTVDPAYAAYERSHRISAWDFLFGAGHMASVPAAVDRIFWFLDKGVMGLEIGDNHVEVHQVNKEDLHKRASELISDDDEEIVDPDLLLDPNNEWSFDPEFWTEELKRAEDAMKGIIHEEARPDCAVVSAIED